jgi:hypothetical protein
MPENGKKKSGNAEEKAWEKGKMQVASGYA